MLIFWCALLLAIVFFTMLTVTKDYRNDSDDRWPHSDDTTSYTLDTETLEWIREED